HILWRQAEVLHRRRDALVHGVAVVFEIDEQDAELPRHRNADEGAAGGHCQRIGDGFGALADFTGCGGDRHRAPPREGGREPPTWKFWPGGEGGGGERSAPRGGGGAPRRQMPTFPPWWGRFLASHVRPPAT